MSQVPVIRQPMGEVPKASPRSLSLMEAADMPPMAGRGSRLLRFIVAMACLVLPWPALATICLQDTAGHLYSIEVGVAIGSKQPLFGSVKLPPCLPSAGNVAPLYGEAVMTDATTVVVGWTEESLDFASRCIDFRERYVIDLSMSVITGDWINAQGFGGSDTLSPSACPSPTSPELTPEQPSPKAQMQ
jgi:hypothetical protein